MNVLLFWLLLLISVCTRECFFDPLLMMSAAAGVGSYLWDNSYCAFRECCNAKGIPANYAQLNEDLVNKLYGQHLVKDVVINALKSHWDPDVQPSKALVISFHGWAGIGKNYVTEFIKSALYKKGGDSKFVHHFYSRIHFPLEQKTEQYKNDLYLWIKDSVSKCPQQLFVFDEVHSMPSQLLDVLGPLIDYHTSIDGVDYRRSVFIFLSSIGGNVITKRFLELWENGKQREDMQLYDYEDLILSTSFNEKGGLYLSENIKSNLIDVYVPFLPLEKKHIKLCILDEFAKRGMHYPNENLIETAMEVIEYGPDDVKLFSKTGCKRISQRVALLIAKSRGKY